MGIERPRHRPPRAAACTHPTITVAMVRLAPPVEPHLPAFARQSREDSTSPTRVVSAQMTSTEMAMMMIDQKG